MVCNTCNNTVNSEAKFCGVCGTPIKKQENKSNKDKSRPFLLSENEVEIKTYFCTRFEKPFAKGYLTVTNKRVIFYSFGESSKRFSEVHINKITGVDTYYGTGHNMQYLKQLILPLILGPIAGIFASVVGWLIVIFGVAYCVGSYIFNRQLQYVCNIIAEGSDSAPISIGSGVVGQLTGQGAAMAIHAIPTQQAQDMMKELGAMLLDLKNLGDHAIPLWKEDMNEESGHKSSNGENVLQENIFA